MYCYFVSFTGQRDLTSNTAYKYIFTYHRWGGKDRKILPKKHIDVYGHVGHSEYSPIFDGILDDLGIRAGKRVSALSVSFGDEFKAGDVATVSTLLFKRLNEPDIVAQEMTKGYPRLGVKHLTKLISPDTTIPLPILPYSPEDKPIMVKQTREVVLPGGDKLLPYTVFTSIFEGERMHAIERNGLSMEVLRDVYNLLIVVVQLDAAYGAPLQGGSSVEIVTDAHLDIGNKSGDYASMTCLQAIRSQGEDVVRQLTRYAFLDREFNRRLMPPEIQKIFTSSASST